MTSLESTSAAAAAAVFQPHQYVIDTQVEIEATRSFVSTLLTVVLVVTLVGSASTTIEFAIWRILIALRYVRLRYVSLTTFDPNNDGQTFSNYVGNSPNSTSGIVESEIAQVCAVVSPTRGSHCGDDHGTRCNETRFSVSSPVAIVESPPSGSLQDSSAISVRLESSSSSTTSMRTLSVVTTDGIRTFCESSV